MASHLPPKAVHNLRNPVKGRGFKVGGSVTPGHMAKDKEALRRGGGGVRIQNSVT